MAIREVHRNQQGIVTPTGLESRRQSLHSEGKSLLGDKLRQARHAKKLTIADLSRETGFSTGYISSIERGHTSPSLAALLKITAFLGVDPGFLFEKRTSANHLAGPLVRRNERLKLHYPGSEFHYELLTRDLATSRVEFVYLTIPPGKSSGAEPLAHEGEEHGLVLEGRIEVTIGDNSYEMGPGDSISFNSMVSHKVVNPGAVKAEAIWIMTPPRL